eukprot:4837731-Prymnesium_polylepis.1
MPGDAALRCGHCLSDGSQSRSTAHHAGARGTRASARLSTSVPTKEARLVGHRPPPNSSDPAAAVVRPQPNREGEARACDHTRR